MKHPVKIVGAIAALTLAAAPFLMAQSDAEPAEQPGDEAAQSAGQAPDTDQPKKNNGSKAEDQAPKEKEAARQTKRPADEPSAPADKAEGSGREAASEKQSARFAEIHERRMAQLERLRDLAVENDREEMVTRVDGLIDREKERYAKKTQRFEARGDRPAAAKKEKPAGEQR